MTLVQEILEKYHQLPDQLQKEVNHYIEFLFDQHTKNLNQKNASTQTDDH